MCQLDVVQQRADDLLGRPGEQDRVLGVLEIVSDEFKDAIGSPEFGDPFDRQLRDLLQQLFMALLGGTTTVIGRWSHSRTSWRLSVSLSASLAAVQQPPLIQHNGPMQISTRHTYHADPQSVVEMMANEVWLTAVARAAGAERWQVSADIAGSRKLAEVPAPDKAKRPPDRSRKIDLTIVWQPPSHREGRIQVAIEGMPASMGGTGEMVQCSTITEVDFNAEFSINLPLIGRGLEVAAVPYVRRGSSTPSRQWATTTWPAGWPETRDGRGPAPPATAGESDARLRDHWVRPGAATCGIL